QIHPHELVRAELTEIPDACAVEHDAVGQCVGCGHLGEFHRAAGRVEYADHIPLLNGEPDASVGGDDRSMRIVTSWIVDVEPGHVSALRIQLADVAAVVRGEPD